MHLKNRVFYHKAIFEHGLTPQGLGWHSRQSQEVRFHQILSLLPHDTASVVDAGCGFGDLSLYLRAQRRETISYTGLEMLSVAAHEARIRTGETIVQCDVLSDPLPSAEFYVCSGALNILSRSQAYRFIRRCFEASTRGMIFNFLSGTPSPASIYNYLEPPRIEQLGKKLGARTVFRGGYYEQDRTAAFYKPF